MFVMAGGSAAGSMSSNSFRSEMMNAADSFVGNGKVGLGFSAIVFVTMRQEDRDTVADFEAGVAEIPEIVTAQRLFGDPDYLLHVAAADLQSYQRLYDDKLAGLPGVQRLTSTLVMKDVVDRGLPL